MKLLRVLGILGVGWLLGYFLTGLKPSLWIGIGLLGHSFLLGLVIAIEQGLRYLVGFYNLGGQNEDCQNEERTEKNQENRRKI